MPDATQRRERLKAVYEDARGCTACALSETRTTVVFGAGNADADLMFIGEAPGANEDKQGLPFVGQAGRLLNTLLEEIGLDRDAVFVANTVKCRPPGNRDPHPHEIETCRHYLNAQVELIEPTVICTLGNFSTKLLREDPTGISRLHGRDEVRVIGGRTIRLLPLYHPAAALYAPSTLQTLRDDFARIPELLARPAPPQAPEPTPAPASESTPAPGPAPTPEPASEPVTGPEPATPSQVASELPAATDPETGAGTEPAPTGDQLGLF